MLCSESAQLFTPDREVMIPCRMKELNWLGVVIDGIPAEERHLFTDKNKQEKWLSTVLPREFGNLKLKINKFQVKEYEDIIQRNKMLEISMNFENEEGIGNIRDFIVYRNRRFSRHTRKRLHSKFLRKRNILMVLFFLAAIVGVSYFFYQQIPH